MTHEKGRATAFDSRYQEVCGGDSTISGGDVPTGPAIARREAGSFEPIAPPRIAPGGPWGGKSRLIVVGFRLPIG